MSTRNKLPLVFKWLGRGTALLLFLFWGAFFVEHVNEWLILPNHIPPRVLIGMAFHGAMLVGLLMMLRWVSWGSVVTVLATIAFFSTIGMRRFPILALINLVPIASLTTAFLLSRHYET